MTDSLFELLSRKKDWKVLPDEEMHNFLLYTEYFHPMRRNFIVYKKGNAGEYFTRIRAPPPLGNKSAIRQEMGGKSSKLTILNRI